jgi:hypothetical protein
MRRAEFADARAKRPAPRSRAPQPLVAVEIQGGSLVPPHFIADSLLAAARRMAHFINND